MATDPLLEHLATETARPLAPAIRAIAEAARARFGAGTLSVLVYGSCLRDGEDRGRLVDLYVLVDTYPSVGLGGMAGRLVHRLPPNVYYLECPFAERTVRAKVALLTLDDFAARVGPGTDNPYFWARFAQPTAIAWSADQASRDRVLHALATAIRTSLGHALALAGPATDPLDLWTTFFQATYRTELRAEPPSRAATLVAADADRWRRVTTLAAATTLPPGGWARRRILGKLLAATRLIKAGFTFQGGADYLAYKIGRHSGVTVELTEFDRRHPVLAGLRLFWRYRRRGAFR